MKTVHKLLRFLHQLARELSDENAYQRHLAWHRRVHSPDEWKAFSDDRLARKYQNGKCC
jgi:Selenoprotein, putative